MEILDYHSLSRRELQNLCKKHGIPANKTNAYMADALISILKVSQRNAFGSSTPTTLSKNSGSKSTPSTMKRQNKRGYSTTSGVPQGNTFSSLDTGSKRTEPVEEDVASSIMESETCSKEPAEENTNTGNETNDDTTKISEPQKNLQHVALSVMDNRKELCQHVNQKSELGSKNPITLYEDVGIKSFPSQIEKRIERGDALEAAQDNIFSFSETRLEGTDPMEEDTGPTVENTYNEKVSEEIAHAEKEKCDSTNKTVEAQQSMQVQSHVLDKEEGHHQQDNATDRKSDQDSLLCIYSSSPSNKAIERDSHEAKIYTFYEERTFHMEGVEQLDQVELCQQAKVFNRKGDEDSLLCTSSSYPCKVANDREDHDAKLHTGDGQTPNHMQRVDHLGQEEHCQQDKVIARNADKDSLDYISSSCSCKEATKSDTHGDKICTHYELMPIHIERVDHLYENKKIYIEDREETLEEHCKNDTEKKSENHIDVDNGNDLLAKKMAIDDEIVKHDGECNRSPFCSGDDEVEKSRVKMLKAEISDRSSSTPFQFLVECDNGIKLIVDLENSSPSDWMKPHNYDFSLPQDLHEHKHFEHSQLKSVKCPDIWEGDAKLEDRKTGSDKLAGFQPRTSDFERSSKQNPTTRSSNFLKNQNFSSTSAMASTKKMDVSREVRRTSSVLIPPHGANRGLSPFMTRKLSRFSSSFISPQNANNISSSSSAIGNSHKSVSTQVNQVNCLPECTQPIMTVTSKAIEDFCIQPGVPEKEMLPGKSFPDSKTVYSIDGSATPCASVESVSVITPIEDRCQDVEMLDQELHYDTIETPQNEADKEGFQNNEKEVESVSHMHRPHKSQKEMQHKSLLQDLQDEENGIISRYKDEYKKSPFTKNLRGMKILARASTMRANILAKRRSMPLVENNSASSQSSSGTHYLPYQSQNLQEKQTLHVSLRGEIGNENAVSPQLYCERDLCASVFYPGVHQERDLSFSGLIPGKDSLPNVCNTSTDLEIHGPVITSVSGSIGRDEARKSSDKISKSNPKLSKRENSAIPPREYQERHLWSTALTPGKDTPLKNIGNIFEPLALTGPVMTSVIGGDEARKSTRISESNLKLSAQPFQAFTKKRFFVKACEESTERMHAQRITQHNALNECLSTQKKSVDKVSSNIDSGHENQKRNKESYLPDLNSINSIGD